MANKRPAYTGRQLILQSLDPLRRAHLEGKIEGLERAAELIRSKPDHSGRTLATMLEQAVIDTRMVIIDEARAVHKKDQPE